jgi:hypothetical protein
MRWRWAHWRARHYLLSAELAYRNNPNNRNLAACERAGRYLEQLRAARP